MTLTRYRIQDIGIMKKRGGGWPDKGYDDKDNKESNGGTVSRYDSLHSSYM